MATAGILLGVLLSILGLAAYAVTGGQSMTALIPTFFGVPLAVLGFLARDERRLKSAMHAASVLALLGLLGSVRGIPGFFALLGGNPVERPAAVIVQTVMAVLCTLFLILAIKSFVDARRARAS
jgi:hypothetical protein